MVTKRWAPQGPAASRVTIKQSGTNGGQVDIALTDTQAGGNI